MLDIVERLHAGVGKWHSATVRYCTRQGAKNAASRLAAARLVAAAIGDTLGVTPYFAVFLFLLRLLQSAFIRGRSIATLNAMTIDIAINNVIIDHARRVLGSPWWRGWSTFAVVCSAEGPLSVGVLSFTIAV
jgi:dolichol-phosphate mannosyltransferase